MHSPDPEFAKLLDRFDSMSEADRQAVLALLPEAAANQLIALISDTSEEDEEEPKAEEADTRYAQYSPLLRRRIHTVKPIRARGFTPGYTVTEKTHSTLMQILEEKEGAETETGKEQSAPGMSLVQKVSNFLFSRAK